MDVEKYLQLIKDKEETKQKLENLNNEIIQMVYKHKPIVGSNIRSIFLQFFTQEELYWADYRITSEFGGKYEEARQEVIYDLDITRYIIDRYVNEFKGKGKVHRGAKYHIYLRVRYNLVSKRFDTKIDTSGLFHVFRDNALSNANTKMFEDAEQVFIAKGIEFEDLASRFEKVKEVLEDWSGYYITEELAR